MIKTIIKRDGRKEPFCPNKLNGWGEWAAKSLGGFVDWSGVVMTAVAGLPEECESEVLQTSLIQACLDQADWAHNRMAGRLYTALRRKQLFGDNSSQHTASGKSLLPSFRSVQERMRAVLGDSVIVKFDYTDEEWERIEAIIDHDRDLNYAHFQIDQIRKKYSLKDRVSGAEFETPQFTFARMAAALAEDEPTNRIQHFRSWYNHFSNNRINAPTPNWVNLGTTHKGYASCCLYTTLDTEASLEVGDHIARAMTAQSAGIGSLLQSRSLGDKVRGGLIEHQGKIPYYNALAGAVKSSLQNGRGGACTTYFSVYDPEVADLIRLKHPMSPDGKRNEDIDYNVIFNRFFVKAAAQNREVFLFNVYTAPDLYQAQFSGKPELFAELYDKYLNDDAFEKTFVNARSLAVNIVNIGLETGRLYLFNSDETNIHTPFIDPIFSSNLCVAPETKILTKNGYKEIGKLKDKRVSVWNGEEWSSVVVRKTGSNKKLVTVKLSDGASLDCTPEHKFYVYGKGYSGKIYERRAHELEEGDRLIKMELPDDVNHGDVEFPNSYAHGFFCGDGTYGRGQPLLRLYGDKMDLVSVLEKYVELRGSGEVQEGKSEHSNRLSYAVTSKGFPKKFRVPSTRHSLESKLAWFAGYLDADGTVAKNGTNFSIQITSAEPEFLRDIRLMLQTMGVHSKVVPDKAGGWVNRDNGKGGQKKYWHRPTERMLISSVDTAKLLELGLECHRLNFDGMGTPNRTARQFVKVVEIVNEGRVDDTFCFTEPKRHMGVFNGVLTGQCAEIAEHTYGYESMPDLYTPGSVGYIRVRNDAGNINRFAAPDAIRTRVDNTELTIAAQDLKIGMVYELLGEWHTVTEIVELKREPEVAMCSLAAICVHNVHSLEEYEDACYYALKMIDKCIHMSDHPLPHVGWTSKQRLSAGVGMTGVAYHMARKKLKYDTKEGLHELHRLAERHMYCLVKASLRLGKELGNAPWMHRTKWPQGWLPVDTYNKNVDTFANFPLEMDWETLRAEIIQNGGIRNTVLCAHMPVESSSKASGGPNSYYPIRDLDLSKTDSKVAIDWVANDDVKLRRHYQLAWDISLPDQVKVIAVLQKFCDQAISADSWIRLSAEAKVTDREMLEYLIDLTNYGAKTRYYFNSRTSIVDANGEVTVFDTEQVQACTSGGCDV